jgi:hypothetical protein
LSFDRDSADSARQTVHGIGHLASMKSLAQLAIELPVSRVPQMCSYISRPAGRTLAESWKSGQIRRRC